VQRVELVFRTKRELLKAVIDVAIGGDDQPVPVLQRDWAKAAKATTEAGEFLAIAGHVVAERVEGLLAVARAAASTDPEIAALVRQLDAQRATSTPWIVMSIIERVPLRSGLRHDNAVDTIGLLMDPAVFRRLTRNRGWSLDHIQHWFTDRTRRLLLPPTAIATRRPGEGPGPQPAEGDGGKTE
jgi:hypothetical protein